MPVAHATKIEYRPQGGGPYAVLADESDPVLGARISGLLPAMRSTPQIEQSPFSPGITPFDRGNRQWTFTFSVERIHAGEGAASSYLATHAAELNDVGNFDLKITTTDGVTYMVNCAITEFTPAPDEVLSSKIRYSFTGGIYTTIEP